MGILPDVCDKFSDSICHILCAALEFILKIIGSQHKNYETNRIMALQAWYKVGLTVAPGLFGIVDIGRAAT